MTVQEIIKNIQAEVANDLQPGRAAELLNQLSALVGNCNDEIRERDLEYAKVLLRQLEIGDKANRAKIRAEISPEFQAKCLARDVKELVVEMIRSLKFYLKSKEEEYKIGKYS